MKPRELSGCRFVSSTGPAWYLYKQPIWTSSTSLQRASLESQDEVEVRDFSLNKAIPQFAAAIVTQIDCDDASNDFIKEKLHSNIRS